jgi:hypothetical protein
MTQMPPLLILSRVTLAPVLFWDCGKMPTKMRQVREVMSGGADHEGGTSAAIGRECVLRVSCPGATPSGVKVPQVRPTDHGNVAVATGHDAPGIPSPQAGQ